MLREVEILSHAIPHKDLCIQWDICTEMIIWDGQMPDRYPNVGLSHPEIMARVKRLSAKVPKDVELGFHLCYGDLDGKHFVDPRDAEKMVDLANALAKTVAHPISYVHMPVPIARTDDAFFEPLRNLKLKPGTELYLGLVHAADDVDGAKQRMLGWQICKRIWGSPQNAASHGPRPPTWCASCLTSMPGLRASHQRLVDRSRRNRRDKGSIAPLPQRVIRNRASRLQRIPMSAVPPTPTKELQRRDWSQWANRVTSHCEKCYRANAQTFQRVTPCRPVCNCVRALHRHEQCDRLSALFSKRILGRHLVADKLQ